MTPPSALHEIPSPPPRCPWCGHRSHLSRDQVGRVRPDLCEECAEDDRPAAGSLFSLGARDDLFCE